MTNLTNEIRQRIVYIQETVQRLEHMLQEWNKPILNAKDGNGRNDTEGEKSKIRYRVIVARRYEISVNQADITSACERALDYVRENHGIGMEPDYVVSAEVE